MFPLLLLFIALPALELALLIEIGSRIGTPATLAIIVITGAVGAFYARREGLSVLRKLQQQMGSGQLPADSLDDGALILIASALLITPGLITDTVGFLLLAPPIRVLIRGWLRQMLERKLKDGTLNVSFRG